MTARESIRLAMSRPVRICLNRSQLQVTRG